MESKQILAAGILSIVMLTSAAPMSVSAKAKAKTPAKSSKKLLNQFYSVL